MSTYQELLSHQHDRLLEFTNPEFIDELFDYTTRPRRSILEVLQEFDTVKLPLSHLLDVIPMMRGRQFSIASGGSLKRPVHPDKSAEGTRFELLIAIVKYRTVIKRIRQGVCTRYIASLQPGQEINVKLQKGGLGINDNEAVKPVIMVGPGTGVAPMRSLIYERQAANAVGASANKSDGLSVHGAFSRDQVRCLHSYPFDFQVLMFGHAEAESLRPGSRPPAVGCSV